MEVWSVSQTAKLWPFRRVTMLSLLAGLARLLRRQLR